MSVEPFIKVEHDQTEVIIYDYPSWVIIVIFVFGSLQLSFLTWWWLVA